MSAIREKVRTIISNRCTALTPAEQVDLERGIYNFTLEDAKRRTIRRVWENPEFQTLYEICARRTISNIDSGSYVGNTRLIDRLKEGEFKPHDIAAMPFTELHPEKWGNYVEMSIKREAKMLSRQVGGDRYVPLLQVRQAGVHLL